MNALNTIKEELRSQGYFRLYKVLGNGNFRQWDWEKLYKHIEGPLKVLWATFLLKEKVRIEELTQYISESVLASLVEKELADISDGSIQLRYSLISFNDIACFVDSADYLFSYNADAFQALYSDLDTAVATYLSLYPTLGFDAMYFANRSIETTLAFRDDRSRRLYSANSELNNISSLEMVAHNDVSACAKKFDQIGCICPGLIELPGQDLPHNVNGGPTGREELRNAIQLTGDLLLENGTSTLFGIGYYGESSLEVSDNLTSLCEPHGLSHQTIVTTSFKMEPGHGASLFNVTVHNLVRGSKSDNAEVVGAFHKYVQSLGIYNACLFKTRITRKSTKSANIVMDLSESCYGTWLI